MKKTSKILGPILTFLCALILPVTYSFAQDAQTDTLPESAYNMKVPKHVVNIYSSFVPYVLFGIVIIGIAYISYRYWSDNRPDDQDLTHHLEH